MENERISGMLQAVQDLKSQYYVGTQEAWKAIKAYALAHENPIRIANEMAQSLPSLHYKPTPERLVGLSNIFEAVQYKHSILNQLIPRIPAQNILDVMASQTRVEAYNWWLFRNKELTAHGEDIDSNRIQQLASELFQQANEERIESNKEFSEFFVQQISGQLRDRQEEIVDAAQSIQKTSVDDYEEILALPLDVFMTLTNFSWEEEFSQKVSQETVKQKSADYMRMELQLGKIIERAERDRVDHRMEYRRSILARFLTPGYIGDEQDYDEIIKEQDRHLHDRTNRLASLRIMLPNSEITKIEERMFHETAIIRRLLGSEKNWVKKFLKN